VVLYSIPVPPIGDSFPVAGLGVAFSSFGPLRPKPPMAGPRSNSQMAACEVKAVQAAASKSAYFILGFPSPLSASLRQNGFHKSRRARRLYSQALSWERKVTF